MEISIFVAKVISLFYLAAAIAAFRNVLNVGKMLTELQSSSILCLVVGMYTLFLGMLLVEVHNIWVNDWTVLITLFGWGAILKGFMFIAFPEVLLRFRALFQNTQLWSFLMFGMSLLFGYFGFMM